MHPAEVEFELDSAGGVGARELLCKTNTIPRTRGFQRFTQVLRIPHTRFSVAVEPVTGKVRVAIPGNPYFTPIPPSCAVRPMMRQIRAIYMSPFYAPLAIVVAGSSIGFSPGTQS